MSNVLACVRYRKAMYHYKKTLLIELECENYHDFDPSDLLFGILKWVKNFKEMFLKSDVIN